MTVSILQNIASSDQNRAFNKEYWDERLKRDNCLINRGLGVLIVVVQLRANTDSEL